MQSQRYLYFFKKSKIDFLFLEILEHGIKKVPSALLNWRNSQEKVATTYSPTTKCSTIGAVGLNFSVRDGKRWNPNAIITWISVNHWRKRNKSIHRNRHVCNLSVCKRERSRRYSSSFQTFSNEKVRKKSFRAISTAWLNTLLCVHLQPINVVVYNDSIRKSNLVASFALRCFQRLSLPDADTRRCPWRNIRYTGGQSVTVLSY